jgi:3-oxoacyl-[acyl-carrier-protein] synthase II
MNQRTEQPITRRRVVITGAGIVSSSGSDVNTFWQNVTQGKSGIGFISLFDTTDQYCKIGGEVKDFNFEEYVDKKELRRMDRYNAFAMAASELAYQDSGLKDGDVDPFRFGAMVSSAAGGIGTIEDQLDDVYEKGKDKGYKKVSPFLIPMMICNMGSGRVSIKYNAKGPNAAVVTACATATNSIGDALRAIQWGEADVMIAGGAEASITPLSMAGFAACRALSLRNDDPKTASRPFDKDRDGFVMSEGAAVLVLEEMEHAIKRGAKIYGEVVGFGRSADATDIVMPPKDGHGAAYAMKAALKDAHLNPDDIDYINAHATSTPLGDVAETNAIKSVFGQKVMDKQTLVSATKSITGHLLGAAGSVEGLIAVLALRDQVIPPTINIFDIDPECDLDYVPNEARKVSGFNYAISNSFGFGGHNASLIFGRWDNN